MPLIDVHAHFHHPAGLRADWAERNASRLSAGERIGITAHVASILGTWGRTSPTYFPSPADVVTGNDALLALMREHPSRIVRAEAISAYLWNRKDSAEAKAALAGVVRPDEKIFLERVRHVSGEPAATFNAKLAEFVRRHPELRPPPPERSTDTGGAKIPTDCDLRPPEQKAPVAGHKGD
jgi:hypothetical protein